MSTFTPGTIVRHLPTGRVGIVVACENRVAHGIVREVVDVKAVMCGPYALAWRQSWFANVCEAVEAKDETE